MTDFSPYKSLDSALMQIVGYCFLIGGMAFFADLALTVIYIFYKGWKR